MKNLCTKLVAIQGELKAPKGQYNSFGKYKYRSCEDILEAVKPLLVKHGLLLTITDDVMMMGDRIYIKATATITDGEHSVSNSAFAREEETKKGMDGSQVTGASSSYARKYALNGMFCIDDTKDSDATNTGNTEQKPETPKPVAQKPAPKKTELTYEQALDLISDAKTVDELMTIYSSNQQLHKNANFMAQMTAKRQALQAGL